MILIINTSGNGIELVLNDKYLSVPAEKQAVALPGAVMDLLKTNNVSMADLKAIGVIVGPGSFTGIRMGIAYAKGLGIGLNIPVVPINALVGQSRATVVVVRGTQHHIVRTTLKGTVTHHIDTSEGLPAHQVLGKFKRAVLNEFAIESAVGSVVDVFKEDAIHRRLNGCSQFLGVDVHDVL